MVGLTIQRPTAKAYGPTSKLAHLWFETSSATRTRAHTIILKENGSAATKKTATMNNVTTAMTGLVGVGQQPPLGPDRDHAVMRYNLSGPVLIISVSQHHGTTKMTHLNSSYFGIVDTAGLSKMIFTFTKVNGCQLRNIQWCISCHIGTGTIRISQSCHG